MRFRDKVRFVRQPVVIYEIIPPSQESAEDLHVYSDKLSSLLSRTHVDAINIPEIRDETTRGARPVKAIPKTEPRAFGAVIQQTIGIEAIVNRCVVYTNRANQQDWLLKTFKDYRIENLVLVGGESSKLRYPGPSVTETADIITKYLNRGFKKEEGGEPTPLPDRTDYFCGGITIPSRRKADPSWDEPNRLIEKGKRGIEFFTSQVIYEAESTKKLLKDYYKRCLEEGVEPRRIVLSFAPTSNRKDIAFLKWLGVEIPPDVESYLLEDTQKIAERSLEISRHVLKEILDFTDREGIEVPLGLNVEHIMNHNFEISIEMIQDLSKLYRSFCIQEALLHDRSAVVPKRNLSQI